MRRLVLPLLLSALVAPLGAIAAQSINPVSSDGSLAGTKEVELSVTGRVLSTAYSVADGRTAIGGGVSGSSHITNHFAVQGALGVAYSNQEGTYYKPPLFVFTPTLSLLLQGSTAKEFQPYALVGG